MSLNSPSMPSIVKQKMHQCAVGYRCCKSEETHGVCTDEYICSLCDTAIHYVCGVQTNRNLYQKDGKVLPKERERTCYLCFKKLLKDYPDAMGGWEPDDVMKALDKTLTLPLREDPHASIEYPRCAVGYCHCRDDAGRDRYGTPIPGRIQNSHHKCPGCDLPIHKECGVRSNKQFLAHKNIPLDQHSTFCRTCHWCYFEHDEGFGEWELEAPDPEVKSELPKSRHRQPRETYLKDYDTWGDPRQPEPSLTHWGRVRSRVYSTAA